MPTADQKKKSDQPEDGKNRLYFTPDEDAKIRQSAAKIGRPVPEFAREMILHGVAKLQDDHLTSIPCPFCRRTDSLVIIGWAHERSDGSNYQGDAVKCERCDIIARVEAWAAIPLYEYSQATHTGSPKQ